MRMIFWGSVLTGLAVLAMVMAGEIYDYQDTVDGVHLPAVDAIVCLAGGRGRIAAAADVWYRYWELSRPPGQLQLPVFYVSGMGPRSSWAVLEKQVRPGVFKVLGPENVVLETESVDTEGNARWLERTATERGWKKVLLITSRYHMRRAQFIFEEQLGRQRSVPIEIETMSVFQEPFEPGEWTTELHGIQVTVGEYLKWLYYRFFWAPSK